MPYIIDAAKDAALNEIIQNADRAIPCNGEPTSYAEADTIFDSGNPGTTFKLAERPVDVSEFDAPADFSDANGSGRKASLTKGGWLGLKTGDATQFALVDDTNSKLLYVGDTPSTVSIQEGFAYNNLEANIKVYDAQTV